MIFKRQTVDNLLEAFGENLTLKSYTEGTYNPNTGSISRSDNGPYTVQGYFSDYHLEEIDGQSVVKGDRRATLSVVDTSGVSYNSPSPGDEISGSNDTVSVVSVRTIYSQGVPVCYICQVRE